jgi:hypothetical protein
VTGILTKIDPGVAGGEAFLTPSGCIRIMSYLALADVAELADAQVSEACDGDIVEVQVLSSAPKKTIQRLHEYQRNLWMVFSSKIFCHGFSEAGVLVLRGPVPKGEY